VATATRTTKSFSLDRAVLQETEKTKGVESTSERVNQLLKVALEVEKARSLHREAEAFFAGPGSEVLASEAWA
jgi:Arc/MetJ family transcription regulator